MKKFLSYILSVFMLVTFVGQAFGGWQTDVSAATKKNLPKAPSIIGESAILIEPTTGTIIYEKDPHKKMYPASITKIMTALLAIENCKMNDTH